VDEGDIGFLSSSFGKFARKLSVRHVILRDYDQSTRLAVKPVHDSRTKLPSNAGEIFVTVQECIYERASGTRMFRRACASVDHHSGWLIDDGEIVVFINDVERNVFGRRFYWRPLGRADDLDYVSRPHLPGCPFRAAIDKNFLFFDQLLDPGATDIRDLRNDELVQSLA
jgi:hypothetical protein